ncbi:MAG: hypothetical protein NTU98_08310 [Bacteroidetes bacterium]|nr:hypothetical protein [Bacteroidota bacterium]
MKILPLPNSKPITGSLFEKGLIEFEKLIEKKLIDCDKDPKNSKGRLMDNNILCGDCCLEFFYFYDSSLVHIPTYKNAIWIKVYNLNNVNIWLRIGWDVNGNKKITVFSECDLNCISLEYSIAYGLPLTFTPTGVWIEKKRIAPISFSAIIDQICKYLDCLCKAKCVKR